MPPPVLHHPSNSGYIKRNKYYLIDVTGRPTRWGVWAPEQINFNQSWADEHGLNSLQILTYLLSAYRVTRKGDYLEGWLVRWRDAVCVSDLHITTAVVLPTFLRTCSTELLVVLPTTMA